MDNWLVGDDDCKIGRIITIMLDSCVFSELMDKWKELALRLETPAHIKKKLNNLMNLGLKDTADVLEEILTEWRQRKSKHATLLELITQMEKCGLNDITKSIKTELGIIECVNPDASNISSKRPLRDHLEYYMMDLIEKTELSPELLQAIGNNKILPIEDLNLLSDSYNCEDGNREFWMLIIKKIADNEKLYDDLTGLFLLDQRNSRNGVFCILNRHND